MSYEKDPRIGQIIFGREYSPILCELAMIAREIGRDESGAEDLYHELANGNVQKAIEVSRRWEVEKQRRFWEACMIALIMEALNNANFRGILPDRNAAKPI